MDIEGAGSKVRSAHAEGAFRRGTGLAVVLGLSLACAAERPPEPEAPDAVDRAQEEIVRALHRAMVDTDPRDVVLELVQLRSERDWAWVEAAPRSADGASRYEPEAALLRSRDGVWTVVERMPAAGEREGTAIAEDCRYFERLRSRHPAAPARILPVAGRTDCPRPGAVPAADETALADALRQDEGEALIRFGNDAARTRPDRLTLRFRDGSRRTFADEVSEDGSLRHLYVYRGLVEPLSAHLVEMVYVPEGHQNLLVDARHGDVLEIDAAPVPSPDSRRFVTASLDLVAGHAPNRIRVYRVAPAGFELEWELEPGEWGVRDPRWRNHRVIEAERVEVDWSTEPLGETVSPLRFEWRGDWVTVR